MRRRRLARSRRRPPRDDGRLRARRAARPHAQGGRGGAAPFDCAEAAEQAADPLYTCASGECIDGAALEDAGGEGTNGSHWEKRLFLGETMCGTTQDGETSAVSALTLALFEDAGWYRPDYDVAAPKCFFDASWCAAADGGREAREPLRWGAGQGCGFLGSCDGDAWDGDGYWCEAPAAEGCTVGRVALGMHLGQYSGRPADFRQYVGLLENAGGRPAEDYCPITAPYRDWDCRYPPRELDNALTAAAAALGEGQARGPRAVLRVVVAQYDGDAAHRCVLWMLRAPLPRRRSAAAPRVGAVARLRGVRGRRAQAGGVGGRARLPERHRALRRRRRPRVADRHRRHRPGDVTPAAGPTSGGTEITIVGTALGGGGRGNGTSRSSSRVYVCGIDAEVLSWKEVDGGGERLIARTGAAGDAAGSELCAGPAAASSLRCAEAPGNHTCHVRVRVGGPLVHRVARVRVRWAAAAALRFERRLGRRLARVRHAGDLAVGVGRAARAHRGAVGVLDRHGRGDDEEVAVVLPQARRCGEHAAARGTGTRRRAPGRRWT